MVKIKINVIVYHSYFKKGNVSLPLPKWWTLGAGAPVPRLTKKTPVMLGEGGTAGYYSPSQPSCS